MYFHKIILIALTISLTISAPTTIPTFPHTFTLLASTPSVEFFYDITTIVPGNRINIQFQILTPINIKSSTILIANFSDTFKVGTIGRQFFYGKSYKRYQNIMDINGMQMYRKQFINMIKQSGKNLLYLTIYNFEPNDRRVDMSVRISMQQNLSTSPLTCFSCSGASQDLTTSCRCSSCTSGFYGQDCGVNMLSLTRGATSSYPMNGPDVKYFRIQQTDQLDITIKLSTGTGYIYFQFISFQGQFASYTNVAVGTYTEGRFRVDGGTQGTKISATSDGTPMSVTIVLYDPGNAQVQAFYQVKQKSNVLVIVLGVLGGLLFIALIIAAIYIIKKTNFSAQTRQVRVARAQQPPNLSDQQIQRFFPTVLLSKVIIQRTNINQQEGTKQNLQQEMKKQQTSSEQCVICLCPVQPNQQIKLTYCKHFFHAQCLAGWFKKQQNCPYCRQEFNRPNAIKLYKKLKQKQQRVLKGQQLVKAIILSKPHQLSNQQISNKSITQIETKKMTIQSRNTIDIQEMNN